MEFKLTIENLGNIEHAELAVKPFTIIAGENSSGKTFATKSLYCVLDAIHRDHVSHRLVLIGLRFERALSMFSTELKDPSQSDIQFMEYVESRFIEWLNALISHSHESVLFKSEAQLLQVEAILKENNILARRYFYPSLDTLDYLKPN
ncbi:MAG: hypothetical protein IBX55_23055, partial [Methyloprofundus sp.]|nr:hypothetical protein [Methyloprofundus sp.]